jgi:hypothetical protein
MIQTLKLIYKDTLFYDVYKYLRLKWQLEKWQKDNNINNTKIPRLLKENTIKEYAQKFGLTTLVETGTFRGDMIYACKHTFRRIYSIELDKRLYEQAKKRFSKTDHVILANGDSAEQLKAIMKNIQEPCLFWLDAHYSGGVTARSVQDTPIIQELAHIFSVQPEKHVILIDDAHEFVGEHDYPTMEELTTFIKTKQPNFVCEVKDNIIRVHGNLLTR